MPHEYANVKKKKSKWTQGKTDTARRLKCMLLLPREMYLHTGDGNKLLHDLKKKKCLPELCVYIYVCILYIFIAPALFVLRKQGIIAKPQQTQTNYLYHKSIYDKL